MGIYDRDYYRRDRQNFSLPTPRTAVGYLLAINIAVYLIDVIQVAVLNVRPDARLSTYLALTDATLLHPLYWWQFVTYAFAHAYRPEHIVVNMFGLWMFGRDVEDVYGPKEFLRIYLACAVFGGMVWALGAHLAGKGDGLIGASGAIAGVVVLYAVNFPRRIILLFFVLPVYAWVAGLLIVGYDAYNAMLNPNRGNVAYIVHLAGAGLAFMYYRLGWNFGRLWPGNFSWNWLRARPRFRIHSPEEDDEDNLSEEVDRILAKISREGEASLTRRERRILKNASREYQRRRRATTPDDES